MREMCDNSYRSLADDWIDDLWRLAHSVDQFRSLLGIGHRLRQRYPEVQFGRQPVDDMRVVLIVAVMTLLADTHPADLCVAILSAHAADLVMRGAAAPRDGMIQALFLAAHRAITPVPALLHIDDTAEHVAGLSVDHLV